VIIQIRHPFFGDNDKIHCGQGVLVRPKAFSRKTLDAVSFMSPFYMFFGDCQTDAGMPQHVQAAEDGDLRRAGPLWLLEDESKMIGS
jgi:hypothetical protein